MKVEFTAKRVTCEYKGLIAFTVPSSSPLNISTLAEREKKRGNNYYNLRISEPHKPRTTGKGSQNHRINGHCQIISVETGQPFASVKEYIKQEALSRGYPFQKSDQGEPICWNLPHHPWNGEPIPLSEGDASINDAMILIDTINQVAAEMGILLPEMD